MNPRPTMIRLICVFTWIGLTQHAAADSALSLLSGFDSERVASVYPVKSDQQAGELAKLMYRLRQLDSHSLAARADRQPTAQLGDAVQFSGTIVSMRTIEVPTDLVEYLGIETLSLLKLRSETRDVEIVTDDRGPTIAPGDRVEGLGVAIEIASQGKIPEAIAAADLRWFPNQVPNAGWQLLRDAGVDISLISELAERNRRPLAAADGDSFYAMLAAAASISDHDDLPEPLSVQPVTMLQQPQDLTGQWIQIDLETVQITRVFVTEPRRQADIGSDHYYQIDAVGDLENVVIKIEPSGDGDRPALFEGRYPVSVVTATLPEFLRRQIDAKSGSDAVVNLLHTKISVTGFFFRLWSYKSEFMNQHGNGNQFGPLLIAATVSNREPNRTAVPGVSTIGTIAALVVIAGVVLTALWQRRTSAADSAIRAERRQRESERVDFHSDST